MSDSGYLGSLTTQPGLQLRSPIDNKQLFDAKTLTIMGSSGDIVTKQEAEEELQSRAAPEETRKKQDQERSDSDDAPVIVPSKRSNKCHVPSACINCKKAHLACDVSRPCKRCIQLGREETCVDIQHKKRGRPKLHDKRTFIPTSMLTENKFEINRPSPVHHMQVLKNGGRPIQMTAQQHQFQFRAKTPNPNPAPRAIQPQNSPGQLPTPPMVAYSFNANTPSIMSSMPLTETIVQPDHIPAGDGAQAKSAQPTQPPSKSSLVLYLSMELCCARVSDEVTDLWEYYPEELAHRSLYQFISQHDSDRLSTLHRLLIDNALQVARSNDPSSQLSSLPPAERTSSDFFRSKGLMFSVIANGAKTFRDTLKIKKRGGEEELYEMKTYLGGGLGADLTLPSTLAKLYIVATFHKHDYACNDASVSMISPSTMSNSNDANLLAIPSMPQTWTDSQNEGKMSPNPDIRRNGLSSLSPPPNMASNPPPWDEDINNVSPPATPNGSMDAFAFTFAQMSAGHSPPGGSDMRDIGTLAAGLQRSIRLSDEFPRESGPFRRRSLALFSDKEQDGNVFLHARRATSPSIASLGDMSFTETTDEPRSLSSSYPTLPLLDRSLTSPKLLPTSTSLRESGEFPSIVSRLASSPPSNQPTGVFNPVLNSSLSYRSATASTNPGTKHNPNVNPFSHTPTRDTDNPYSTLASRSRYNPTAQISHRYTHPANAYFAQTSSSTLNATASIVHKYSNTTAVYNPVAESIVGEVAGETRRNDKKMSVNSLLC